ncbi:MAG: hypothetical protein ACE5KM_15330 [Planctomycetaceae bacterium]
MSVHRMHLKGPWDYEFLTADGETGTVTMPADWQELFGAVPGRAIFRRRFHEPTNLDDDERVWIVFDGVAGRGRVTVNGAMLGDVASSPGPQRFDMTAHLLPFSELLVELEYDPKTDGQPGGLHHPVAIEIESPD